MGAEDVEDVYNKHAAQYIFKHAVHTLKWGNMIKTTFYYKVSIWSTIEM